MKRDTIRKNWYTVRAMKSIDDILMIGLINILVLNEMSLKAKIKDIHSI